MGQQEWGLGKKYGCPAKYGVWSRSPAGVIFLAWTPIFSYWGLSRGPLELLLLPCNWFLVEVITRWMTDQTHSTNTITTTTQAVPSRLAKPFPVFFVSCTQLCPSVAIARTHTHTSSFNSGGFVGIYSIHPYAKELISNSKSKILNFI